MISPTGINTIRKDLQGSGKYGAPRSNHWHKGTDYICVPGNRIVAPISGIVNRIAKPYANSHYSGLVITGVSMCIKMFYLEPDVLLIGKKVLQGDSVGWAQDISKKYEQGMTPHIHLEITHINPDIFINEL